MTGRFSDRLIVLYSSMCSLSPSATRVDCLQTDAGIKLLGNLEGGAGRELLSYLPDCPANCLWWIDLPFGCEIDWMGGCDNDPHSHHLNLQNITFNIKIHVFVMFLKAIVDIYSYMYMLNGLVSSLNKVRTK